MDLNNFWNGIAIVFLTFASWVEYLATTKSTTTYWVTGLFGLFTYCLINYQADHNLKGLRGFGKAMLPFPSYFLFIVVIAPVVDTSSLLTFFIGATAPVLYPLMVRAFKKRFDAQALIDGLVGKSPASSKEDTKSGKDENDD